VNDSARRRTRGVHWWTSVAFIALGLLTLLAITVQAFSGQLLIEDRYWSQLAQSISREHARQVHEGRAATLPDTGFVRSWYVVNGRSASTPPPEHLAVQPPGMYSSDTAFNIHADYAEPEDGRSYHALVVDLPPGKLITQIDIEPLEQQQNRYGSLSALWILAFGVVIAGFITWLHANLVRPVRDLAARMQTIDPGVPGARLPTNYKREEVQVIAQASNAHLERVEQFIQRERSLLDQASHEFRTPIAVIAGAADVLRQQPLPGSAGPALARIEHAVEDLSETMVALLYLAREPLPGGEAQEITVLHDLLAQITRDHEHLLLGKPARLQLGEIEPTFIAAPEAMVRIAASNLIRNAIENTEQGDVSITLKDGVLTVVDASTGFDPVEAARRYRDLLRQSAPTRGQGLGLFLIGRICERFGWTLDLSASDRGARVALDMSASRIDIP
jgi:signal transduction histidine kinase